MKTLINKFLKLLLFISLIQPQTSWGFFFEDDKDSDRKSKRPKIHDHREIELKDLSRKEVILIQKSLRKKRFYTGKIDGAIGKETLRALEEFKKYHHIYIDKNLTFYILKALNIEKTYASF